MIILSGTSEIFNETNLIVPLQGFIKISIALIILIPACAFYIKVRRKNKLIKGFRFLGDMKGKTKEQIISIVGKPNLEQDNVAGNLCIWATSDYGIAVNFDNLGNFINIIKEQVL